MLIMSTDNTKKEADQSKKPDQQKDTEKEGIETSISKNPNPRANENLTEKDRQEADTGGVGSEITDGEDG
jgi:hypothetical protein